MSVTSSFQINPSVIAHRGASGYAPENTFAAFTKAALLGIRWVEFDVMLAACGTPIVFHDETLKRTTGESGSVIKHTYSSLQTMDAGSWFDMAYASERIPSLELVMAWLKDNNMCANVEIKPHPGQEELTVTRSLPIIKRFFQQPNPSILFSSFSLDSMRALRTALPDANLGLLMHDWLDDWRHLCAELNCTSVNINHEIVTRERAREIKNNGQQLFAYTVDSVERANELNAMGVDAVFSNVPDYILHGSKQRAVANKGNTV